MTFPRTVRQHTTHGADRTLTFEDGIEAAAKLMANITGEGCIKSAPGHCARGWKIGGDECPKCGASSNQNCPGDIFDGERVATAIRALSHKEPTK